MLVFNGAPLLRQFLGFACVVALKKRIAPQLTDGCFSAIIEGHAGVIARMGFCADSACFVCIFFVTVGGFFGLRIRLIGLVARVIFAVRPVGIAAFACIHSQIIAIFFIQALRPLEKFGNLVDTLVEGSRCLVGGPLREVAFKHGSCPCCSTSRSPRTGAGIRFGFQKECVGRYLRTGYRHT